MRRFVILLVLLNSLFFGWVMAEEEFRVEDYETIYQLIKDNKDQINEVVGNVEIPSILKGMASGRIILHVDEETLSLILDRGVIQSITPGTIENPTSEIWTSRSYVNQIATSGDPLGKIVDGLNSGKIEKKDHGVFNKVKGAITSIALRVINVIKPSEKAVEAPLYEPEAKEMKTVSGTIDEISSPPENGKYVIDSKTTDVKKTTLEIHSGGEDIGGKEITISEFSGYKQGEAPEGVADIETSEDEGSLGTFVKIDAPGIEVERLVIKIAYSEDEVAYRGLLEDTLQIKWYDDVTGSETYGTWTVLKEGDPSWVNSAGVDLENNFVWADVSHLSVYGITGSISPVPIERPGVTVPRETKEPKGFIQKIISFFKRLFGGE